MKKTLIAGLVLLTAAAAAATTAKERLAAWSLHRKMASESLLSPLKWREIGPYFCSGRLVDIEAYADDPFTFYVAAASGGLWKTENNGTTWTPLFDSESANTIGAIAISQTDRKLIWLGSGEANSLRSSYAGIGVFKSIDGGKTWQHMGLEESHHIPRIVIDPKDPNIVYVAALGHLYTDNEERGLYKTGDGGKTWEKILYVSPRAGIVDVVMHPADNRILYAASWEKERKAWNMVEGGEGSAIWKSTDAGKTWNKIVNGFPQDKYVGRIGLAVTPAAPDALYAFLDNQEPKSQAAQRPEDANAALFRTTIKGTEVYRSPDGGATWLPAHTAPLQSSIINTYGYFFGQIAVSPADPETIYILGVPLMQSRDGGKTFKEIPPEGWSYGRGTTEVHADHHALWINPKNPKHILDGNDGGLNISYDEGATFQKVNNIPLAQCYTIHYDFEKPYNVYTGLQDNGVNMGPANFRYGDAGNVWRMIVGGDGAFVQPMPDDSKTVYAASQFGNVSRVNMANRRWTKGLAPRSEDPKSAYRLNWLSPFMISQHDPYVLYMGANRFLKLTAPQDRWQALSPDLTDAKNTDGDVPFATITAIDESPLTPAILYAGTDDGNVWVSADAGKKWDKIAGLPKKWVTRIVASKYKKDRVYLSMTGYREDDFATYLFASEDMGKTWKPLKANLPDEPVNVIREDPALESVLYLGTDYSVYVSLDRGLSWHSLRCNLPTVAVYDLRVHPRDNELIIGTHGRGVFTMPVEPIRRLAGDTLKKPVAVLPPQPVLRPYIPPMLAEYASRLNLNSEMLVYLREAGAFTLEITDSAGKPVRTLSLQGRRGLNQVQWNLKAKDEDKALVAVGDYMLTCRTGKSIDKAVLEVREAAGRFRFDEPEPGDER